jgi:hypothetical protein
MSYELMAILATSALELAAALAGFIYLGRQGRYTAEHMAVTNRYLADQITVVGQKLGEQTANLAEQVKSTRQDLEAQLRRNAYLQTLMHDWNADRLKEILALLQKGEL